MASNDTRRLRVVVTGDSTGAQESLQEVGKASKDSESKLASLAKGMAGFAGKGVLALGAVGAAAATMGFSAATRLEQVSVGFKTMLGSAQKAQAFLKQLQQFANTTPFEFDDVTGAAQKFLAMGFAAKDVIPMLTAVGDAVAAMGGGAEQIDTVTTALSQMQSKGKVAGEEIMQLTEQGIPALQILADKFGVSTGDMSKMISKGQVLSSKAIPMIIDALENGTKHVKGFGGMMSAQSETMAGKWSTFMDTMKTGLGNLATQFLPMAKKAVETASNAFQNFFAGLQGQGKIKGFTGTLNQIGLGLRAMIAAFKGGGVTSDGLVGKFEKLGVMGKQVVDTFKAIADNTMGVIGWFKEHTTVTIALTSAIAALVTITKIHATVMAVQQAGGLLAMIKNIGIVATGIRIVTALQWAWNGAVAAAGWIQAVAGLTAYVIQQKAVALWTKVVTAAQWLWNVAMDANPIGLIVIAIGVLVGAFILLWKNSDGFRNWVLGTLWPSLQKAFNQLKDVFMVVVNAIVAAWDFTRDRFIKAWQQIVAFFQPIVNVLVAIFSPIFAVINRISLFIMQFYNAVWKIVWILIQIAVKVFVFYIQTVVWPALKVIFNLIASAVHFLVGVWQADWNLAMAVIKVVVGWITGVLVPSLQRAWDQLKAGLNGVKNFFVAIWNAISGKVVAAFNVIAGPAMAIFARFVNVVKSYLNNLKAGWNLLFDVMKNKVSDTMNKVVAAFNKGKDGIAAAWNKVVAVAKAPVNFVINEVYNKRIRTLWNKVAEKFGISTRLDEIKGFARGGVVGNGKGTKDDQLALLTRGEGILTTREMQKLGGPKGFTEFRRAIAQYNHGGVVGGDGPGSWFSQLASKGKNIIQGLAGSVVKPLANAIKSFAAGHLQGAGMSGLMRGGVNTIVDKLVSWVSGKDKDIGAIGGAGGAIGWKAMQALIGQKFPGLHMISGFRPGAHTLSGNLSYHAMGRAVDFPANRALALWIRSMYGSKTKELITPWNELNLWNGRPHRYTGAVWNQHNFAGGNAHDHWAMDSATTVNPGWFTGFNGTGKKETLVNSDLIPGGVTINGGLHLHGVQDVKGLRDEIVKLSKRNGGRSGLPNK